MSEIFYKDVWRMDWGLGNPNKTAALIAMLLVAFWALAYVRRGGFWIAVALFTGLGGCLIHTFSRGGLIASFAGLLPLVAVAPRPWPLRRVIAVGFAVWGMIAFSIILNAHERYGQGVAKEDRSITNRIDLWKVAPVMMADAPQGWGIGNSGRAFMQWYQAVDRSEDYRTMVNSHLTWLVEFGWIGRFLYILGWAVVFRLCWPSDSAGWLAIPLGVWIALAVAASFSSVAESPWLWIVPILSVAAAIGYRICKCDWPKCGFWGSAAGVAFSICFALWLVGRGSSPLHYSAGKITIGNGRPTIWIMADENILGRDYGKSLRHYLQEHSRNGLIGIVQSVSSLPVDLDRMTVVIAGVPPKNELGALGKIARSAERIVFLSPGCYPQEAGLNTEQLKMVEAVFGEFSQSPYVLSWEESTRVRRLSGAGDFLPFWPKAILEDSL